ncbi:adenine phosphoribosyltransferase [Candidatus Woesearchaeota archaeon]|jgi:adenine phosphoribosyltransferase|nr:adenine phosphoribosyltransferase [Candidatus Woesearchaeota archaeon]|tara:strand:- start:3915 stop:4436 length:522 start_codon:yes stop_codon:yes gene_type:complete
MDLKKAIRTIPDWPKPGIMFRDITTLLENPEAFKQCCDELYERYKDKDIDVITGIESRGFVFGSVLAYKLKKKFVLIRKPGKLPGEIVKEEYSLEYGTDTIEMHKDSIKKGDKVLIIDDLIATGGTVSAAVNLVKKLRGEVIECAFVIELPDLKGIDKLKEEKVFTMIKFEGD